MSVEVRKYALDDLRSEMRLVDSKLGGPINVNLMGGHAPPRGPGAVDRAVLLKKHRRKFPIIQVG
ncbi:MAG: hypothetical protein WDA16_10320 [Candidatus Thermoplasmatota archaeon]